MAHDDVTDVGILSTEVNHQTSTENLQGKSKEEAGPLEVLGVSDPNTEDDTPEGRSDVVDLGHVTSVGDSQVVDDVNEVVEVQVPRVEAEVQDSSKTASSKDCALLEELPADEVSTGGKSLPGSEGGEEEDTDDDHGDEGS